MHKINKREPPRHFAIWKRRFETENGREPVYDDLIGTEEYIRLKQDLVEEQGYICCYCEKRIGLPGAPDCDIEHFMPRHPDKKSMTPEQYAACRKAQLDYDNMLASCRGEALYILDHCNHRKENWFDFDVCISPASPAVESLFGFRMSGKMIGRDTRSGADEMIKQLNLNAFILCEQRKAAYDVVLEMDFDEPELQNDDTYLADTIAYYREIDENGRYTPFCSMITYCLRSY